MTKRIDNWTKAFAELCEEKQNQPFVWGTNDCCLFASDFIKAITQIDPAAELRGRYSTALGAARVTRKYGTVDHLADAYALAHGWPKIPVSMARRGDIVCAVASGSKHRHTMLGVWVGRYAIFAGIHGPISLPRSEIIKAWRI